MRRGTPRGDPAGDPGVRGGGSARAGGDGEWVSMRLIPLPAGVAQDATAAAELRERLHLELGCETMLQSWQGQGLLRVSAQIYNRPQEYERLADGFAALLGSTPDSTSGPTLRSTSGA